MATILLSPFFLLFCTTSGSAAYLAHRRFVVRARPTWGDQMLTIITAFEALSLLYGTYQIRNGTYAASPVHPSAATAIASLTALGVAAVAIECVLASNDAAD